MKLQVKIVEVSPRDGLQNESVFIPTRLKRNLIEKLLGSGLEHIEITSFVSPKWIPQLADAQELCESLELKGKTFYALVPNLKGLERAMEAGIERIALFTAASETFCLKNINMTQSESLDGFRAIIDRLSSEDKFIRAYISTAFECPFEGRIDPSAVVNLARKLFDMGVSEISLGDTIGTAGPKEVKTLVRTMQEDFDLDRLALHFHDTNGTAIANVSAGLEEGIRIFDASAGGLGGCPYAPGAGGNLSTEDLVYFMEREGLETGVDLDALAAASLEVLEFLPRLPTSKAQLAALSRASEGPSSR